MSKCWYCNEEITTGNNLEHIGICDKCYKNTFGYGNEFIRNMIIKTTDLKKQLALTEKALELACKEYSKLYCEHYCHRKPCDECENGDYKFFKSNFIEEAKEMMKSE